MTMDNLSHITPTVIETALAALVRGRDRIIGEYAGYGCESTIYEIDAAIAALKGEEYVRVPVGGDVVIPNRPVGQDFVDARRIGDEIDAAAEEARDVAIARAEAREEAERDGMDWDNQ